MKRLKEEEEKSCGVGEKIMQGIYVFISRTGVSWKEGKKSEASLLYKNKFTEIESEGDIINEALLRIRANNTKRGEKKTTREREREGK